MAGIFVGIKVLKKETDFTAHISDAHDSPDFSSFMNDFCLRVMLVIILLGSTYIFIYLYIKN